jgi:putative colanic acid biosynthesis UDP-glucose lipid carrier transferase
MPHRSHSLSPLGMLRLLLVVADPLLVAGALPAAAWLRPGGLPAHQEHFELLGLVLLPLTALAFPVLGAYGRETLGSRAQACSRAMLGLCAVGGVVLLSIFAFKTAADLSRFTILAWLGLAAAALCLARLAAFFLLRRMQEHGHLLQPIVLAGREDAMLAFAVHVQGRPDLGLRVVGLAGDALDPGDDPDLPCLPLAEVVQLAARTHARRVMICAPLSDHSVVETVMRATAPTALEVELMPDFSELPVFCLRVGELGGRPVLSLSGSPLSEGARLIKATEDRVLSALILVGIAPLMVVIALAIRCVSPGPVLFVQERHGRGGRIIRVLKFRSMHPHAPPSPPTPAEVPAQSGEARPDSETFRQATADDPRIFPLGRFLRRTSLDELPQFINVLRGEMSIVGPRPHAVQHNAQFSGDIAELMRRHYVKPGITGLAQINGARGETRTVADMRRRIELDLYYIRNWSLWLDLRIIALTAVRGFYNREP